jgi:protein O-GlcNAc transferase
MTGDNCIPPGRKAMHDERQILERALALHNKGDAAAAAKLYRRIIEMNPGNVHALHFLGVVEAAAGNIDRARSLMARSLQSGAVNIQFIENYVAVLHRAADHEATIELCRRGLQLAPASATLLQASAAALSAQGRHSDALGPLQQLLARHPDHVAAHFMLGSAFAETRQYEAAVASYDRALALNPQLAEAHLNKGTIHTANARYQDALAAYDSALAVRPGLADAWLARGYTLIQLARHDEALAAMDKALTLRADFTEAWVGRGNALLELDRPQEAALAYDHALLARPEFAAAWSGHGNVSLRLGQHKKAGDAFDRAIAADANFAEAWLGRGTLSLTLGHHEDALTALDRSLALNPSLANAWLARGQAAYLEKRYDQAQADWTRALALRPDQPGLEAACLRVRMHRCDWTGFEQACASVRSSVQNGKQIAPFMFVAIPSTATEQQRCARRWIEHNLRSVREPLWRGERYDHDRIHVAYLSADFHQHATAQLMAGVFEHHDRSRFQITGISVGPDDHSDMRRRVEAAFEHFVDAKPQGDEQIADLVRTNEVDILVDLKGYTQDARTGVLAMRPAPLQVNYLGFPGTIGADFIDYIIADRNVIPEDRFGCYVEKIVWLPDSYQANDRARAIADDVPARTDHGLPNAAFVFCCFNDNYKITPSVFASWIRILLAVENSVLWLFEDNPVAADNLRREAATRGISPQRVVFARRLPVSEHLARHRCADLFLDTLPYGAHTTASDALWSGLPVVTCVGETFAGRVGASLLNAVGLPELVTTTPKAYEEQAIGLARNPAQLATLRAKLARNRLTTPLFDTARFTRHLEAAYATMMARYHAGLPPDHIRLDRSAAAAVNA